MAGRTPHGDNDDQPAKQAKKEAGEDNFAVLRPIREKYGRLVSQDQRAALLAQVIAYITAGTL